MINNPTVLVLGAGASNPYAFPLGTELKTRIINHLRNVQIVFTLTNLGFDKSLLTGFQEALRFSVHSTIDIFLEKKPNFRELGSYLIASTIIPFERPDQIFPQRDWYGDLYDSLNFEDEQPDTGQLSVVTLNYDRSFEHFLTKNIDYNCQHERVEFAHTKRNKIEIVHAHGSLGHYPEVPYGIDINNGDALKQAAGNIKIVSDRLEDSEEFQKAQDIISKAESAIFLGFGYDERTLKALLAKSKLTEKRFYGTSVNLDEEALQRVHNIFEHKIKLDVGMDCQRLLKNIHIT